MVEKSCFRKRADQIRELRCWNLIAVLENPYDMHNIGAVVRNANALGVDKVYIVDQYKKLPSDWQEMKAKKQLRKSSASAISWTFVKTFSSTDQCLAHLEKNNFISIATAPSGKGKINVLLEHGDYTKHKKLAVWFGSESAGISDVALAGSEMCVSVPMAGLIDSLNLATTSGIVLNEVARQRRGYIHDKRVRKGRV